MMGLIYKLTCKINNKCYVGQTINGLKKRIYNHVYDANERNSQLPIHKAIRKYGISNFNIEVIENDILLENLNEREIFYTNECNALSPNGYVLKVGNGHNTLIAQETRDKISNSGKLRFLNIEERLKVSKVHKGKIISNEQKSLISVANKGKVVSEGTKIKMSQAHKGKKRSPEHTAKIAKYHKGKIISDEHKEKMAISRRRAVICFDLQNNFICEFDSITTASKTLNLEGSNISRVCSGKRKTVSDYIFRYKNNQIT